MIFSPSPSSSTNFIYDDTLPSDFCFSTSSSDCPILNEKNTWNDQLRCSGPLDQTRHCMSAYSDEWMQPSGYSDFDLEFPQTAFPQEQLSTAPSDYSRLYGQQWYNAQGLTGVPQSQQQALQSHRRFPSTSSVASGPESQFSRQGSLSAQPYPNTQPHLSPFLASQQPQWSHDNSSPLSTAQHLPTPTRTPTSDKQFQVPNARRSNQPARQDAALVAAHNSVRLALNQQWRPTSTYMSSPLQSRVCSSQNMPRTPQTVSGDDMDVQAQNAASASIPKLDRTVSDARADELYNPATFPLPPTAAPRTQPQNSAYLQTQPSMLQDRLRDANEARSASPSQTSGHASPWRDSPYGDGAHYDSQNMVMPAGTSSRDTDKSQSDTFAMRQRRRKQDTDEPQTVSPKDAFPEQQIAKEDENLPSLFPTDSSHSQTSNNVQYAPISQEYGSYSSASMPQSGFSFTMPTAPASAHTYYQQPPTALQYGPVNANPDYSYPSYQMPARLVSMDTTKSDESEARESSPEIKSERPTDTLANGGRYTCTYSDIHGQCHARFDNPTDLNKHKREVHRQQGPLNHDAKRATAMTQSGPHKCTRINPSTGKPCNTVFSRPYDLTRHQDTIHGEGKKLKCPHCAEEKLFSRNDALTRHLKVVHSQDLPTTKGRGRRAG